MLTKSRYITPVYRGSGYGKRKRKKKWFFILLLILIILYLAFALYSRRGDFLKEKKKPLPVVPSPSSCSAVQLSNGMYRFTWSSVKGADGYRLYKYNNDTKRYNRIKEFGKSSTGYISNTEKTKYAVKAIKKTKEAVAESKNYTLCKMKSITDMIEIVGHRGAMDRAPENTLASYKRAFELGYPSFETDYFETKSGDLIISHDRDISIFTDKKQIIDNITLTNRKDYPITKGVDVDKYATQYMPTFEEAVQSAARFNMNIYLHTKNPDISDKALKKIETIIKKNNMRDKATVFTPNRDLFKKMKKYDIRVGFLMLPESAADITDAIDFSGKNKADVLIMRYTKFLTKNHLKIAHRYNLKVGCYDRSSLKSAFYFVDFKLDFMVTNRDFIN